MESLKELYRIGPGPSSSHTLAVRNACLYYKNKYPDYSTYLVELFGSLGLTGKGHMSDKIIESVFGFEHVIIRFNKEMYGKQPNTMIFHTLQNNQLANEMIIYSIGGGAIEIEGIGSLVNRLVYPQANFAEIVEYCQQNRCNLAQYVYHYEPEIKPFLNAVMTQMILTVRSGLRQDGVLPGPLQLEKIAKRINIRAKDADDPTTKQKLLLSSYAYASMEENASGHIVVTAPTLGSCGVVSSLVYYYYESGVSKETICNGLAVAGVIGNIIKTNATISGAVGGCQAEIGTACAMAAAMASYIEGLSTRQIGIASEIAIEHHLGLTCDPVGGYVQVPCIERNGVAALRAMDAMLYAKYLGEIKESKVSFDKIVETMNYTGKKIAMELRETSLGGLAIALPVDKNL